MIKYTKQIYAGDYIFDLVATHGVPLATILSLVDTKNGVVDWKSFARRAIAEKWNKRSLKSKIVEACNEVYGAQTLNFEKLTQALIDSL